MINPSHQILEDVWLPQRYLIYIYNVASNFNSIPNYSPSKDITKCMIIGTVFSLMVRFGRGRVHYLQYIKSGLLGTIFGIGYSVLYVSPKIDKLKAIAILNQE